jgi:sphingomyelin phosphodiesterase
MLEKVVSLNPDLFFWTGDNSAHNVWSNSDEEVSTATINITIAIQKAIEGSNITVYPIQGNHDTWPVNVENFQTPNSNIPINTFSKYWEQWLEPETMVLFRKWGYYSQTLKLKDGTVFGNTKIIGLNTQVCNNMNWFLLENRFDPAEHIKWLENELLELEKINGQAIIISHIAGDDCIHSWGHRLRGLFERFQHVIRFHLTGHTHEEQFHIVQSVSDNKPIGFNLVAGSLTTMTGYLPSFSLLEIDAETMVVLKQHTYMLNITKANEENGAEWEELHEFTALYGIEDMSPASLFSLAESFKTDEAAAIKYRWNESRHASAKMASCDEACRHSVYCEVTSSEDFQHRDCSGTPHFDWKGDPTDAMMNFLLNPWVSTTNSTMELVQ